MKHTQFNDNSFRGITHTFSGSKAEGLRLVQFLVEHDMGFKFVPTLPDRVVVTDVTDDCFEEIVRIKQNEGVESVAVENEPAAPAGRGESRFGFAQ